MLPDLVILVVIVLAGISGWRIGGAAIAVHVVGLLVGLVLGLEIAGLLSSSLSPAAHVILGFLCAIGGLIIGGALGSRIGARVTLGLARSHLGVLDHGLGALARALGAAVVIWIVLALVVALGPDRWARTVQSARLAGSGAFPIAAPVISGITDAVRKAAPGDVAALIPDLGTAAPTGATVERIDAAVADSVFVVRANGCKGSVVGTGWVAANGLIVTNAHVVRGATDPVIQTSAGELAATPVVFDRRADLAILRVDGLDAAALPLASNDAANGTRAVIVGYPGGGPRTAVGAVVAQRLPLPDPGFSDGLALHQTYRLDAIVRPGKSVSPLLKGNGRVIGVVNASSGTTGSTGYAITDDELRPDLAQARSSSGADTGTCS